MPDPALNSEPTYKEFHNNVTKKNNLPLKNGTGEIHEVHAEGANNYDDLGNLRGEESEALFDEEVSTSRTHFDL